MGCDDVKRVAYFYLDGQLGHDRGTEVSSHLKQCRDCDDRVTIHKRLRDFFRGRLTAEKAPGSLRDRLQGTFASLRTQTEPI